MLAGKKKFAKNDRFDALSVLAKDEQFLFFLNHIAAPIKKFLIVPNPEFCQFLLDSSAMPEVIKTCDTFGLDVIIQLFNITRSWVYIHHTERLFSTDTVVFCDSL